MGLISRFRSRPLCCRLRRHHLIDMWPQPGLLEARSPLRGPHRAPPGTWARWKIWQPLIEPPSSIEQYARLGVDLRAPHRSFPVARRLFSDLDLFIAVRDWPWHLIRTKPSTKLVHAWITGVPALLGPEPSYQYWGRNNEDYFEVRSPTDVLNLVQQLRRDRNMYKAPVRDRGSLRAAEHDTAAVLKQWTLLLDGPVQSAFKSWGAANPRVWQYRAAIRSWQRLSAPMWQKWFTIRSRGTRALSRRRGS